MATKNQTEIEQEISPTKGLLSYVLGFVFAIVLTLIAYFATVNHILTGMSLAVFLMALATVQLLVQLVFFLHLGRDKKARWNVASFYFMLLVLLIVVIGSLWIMHNLNYNMMMTPEQMDEYMLKQSMKGF